LGYKRFTGRYLFFRVYIFRKKVYSKDSKAVGIAILNDIGWEANLITGGLDQVNIHGFNYNDFINNPFSQPPYISIPSKNLNIGEYYYYQFKISNNVPPNMSTAKWKIEVIYDGGRHIIEECGQACIQTDRYYHSDLLVVLKYN